MNDGPSKVEASHILLTHAEGARPASERTKDEAKTAMEAIKAELDGGADFADLASEHSECPSGQSGGSLGEFARNMMVKEFEDAAFALGVGETSDIVETDFGFHLIQRTG
ncbi:MAG: peptidylprolyl isomerase [Rhodospirillales bacterium]|nr:peptidylprolyl isomerase [Rhodospirillales bacterium]